MVLVPAAAVIREGNEAVVFVAAGDKAERRIVEVGLTDGEHVEITKGLKAGELVITKGMNGLPDDAKITTEPVGKEGEKDKEHDKDQDESKGKEKPASDEKGKAPAAGRK